jgi:hypothetical protein
MSYGASGNQCEPCEQTLCSGFVCTDLSSDDFNCGQCGNPCPDGRGCRNGTCEDCRRSGEVCAGGDCCSPFDYCHDFGTVKLCATCFAPREVCNEVCCAPDEQCCFDQYCSGLGNDTDCASCGNACDTTIGEHCYDGQCDTCAPPGWGECGSNAQCCSGFCQPMGTASAICATCQHTICGDFICADLMSDAFHCGACNNPCGTNQECIDGGCVDL